MNVRKLSIRLVCTVLAVLVVGSSPLLAAETTVTNYNDTKAALAINYDTELYMAGMIHSNGGYDPVKAAGRSQRTLDGWANIIADSETYGIPISFNICGHEAVFGDAGRSEVTEVDIFHDWHNDNYWESNTWYSDLPQNGGNYLTVGNLSGTTRSYSLVYGGPLTEQALNSPVPFQISYHNFGHENLRFISDNIMDATFRLGVQYHKRIGSKLTAIAPPWNSSPDASKYPIFVQNGIFVFHRKGDSVGDPYEAIEDLWIVPRITSFNASADLSSSIDSVIADGSVFAPYSHPEEGFHNSTRTAFQNSLAHASSKVDSGELWATTLSEIGRYHEAASDVSTTTTIAGGATTVSIDLLNYNETTFGIPYLTFITTMPNSRNYAKITVDFPSPQTLNSISNTVRVEGSEAIYTIYLNPTGTTNVTIEGVSSPHTSGVTINTPVLTIDSDPPADPPKDSPITIQAFTSSTDSIYAVNIIYQVNDDARASAIMTPAGSGVWQTQIGPFDQSDAVEYYVSATDHSGRRVRSQDQSFVVSDGQQTLVTVPDVVGLSQVNAESAIIAADLTIGSISSAYSRTIPAGSITSQNPAAGATVTEGSLISLVVSDGPQPVVTVPDVVGLQQATAEAAIIAADLTVGTITYLESETVPVGDVISQSPTAGASALGGSPVDLVVSALIPSGLAIDLSFDDASGTTALDSSGNDNHGMLINSPTWSTGQINGELCFNGSNDYVEVPDAPSLHISDQLTIAAWIYPQDVSSWGTIASRFTGTRKDLYWFVARGTIGASLAGPSGLPRGNDWKPNVSIDTDTWTHIALTYNGSELTMYKNGAPAASTPGTGPMTLGDSSSTESFYVAANSRWGEYFNGCIDQLSLYNRALTALEIQRLHAPQPPVTVPDVVGLPQANAESAIVATGLTVGTITFADNATVPAGDVVSQNPLAGASATVGSPVNLVVSNGPPPITAPDVVGLPQATAEAAIVAANLTVGTITFEDSDTVPAGDVIRQSPAAGTSLVYGSPVNLVVSNGPPPPPATVPDVVGLPQTDAEATIIAANLTVGTISLAPSETIPVGDVITQNPAPGTTLVAGSPVDLVISELIPPDIVLDLSFDVNSGLTAFDLSGNNNHGNLVNGPFWSAGQINGALCFDATDDYVEVPDAPSLHIADQITIAAWINPENVRTWSTIISKFTGTRKDLYLFVARGTIGATLAGPSGLPRGRDWKPAVPIDTDAWTHVALTYDGSELTMYKNGLPAASIPGTGPLTLTDSTSNESLYIGANKVWGEHFNGCIDELTIYNRALTAPEIQNLFAQD